MTTKNGQTHVVAFERELAALERDIQETKQHREQGLQRLDDLRAENARLQQQIAQLRAHQVLTLKVQLLRQHVAKREREKKMAELVARSKAIASTTITDKDDYYYAPLGNWCNDNGCARCCSTHDRQPRSNSLGRTTLPSTQGDDDSSYSLNQKADDDDDDDNEDSGFFFVQNNSVYEGFSFRPADVSKSNFQEPDILSCTDRTDSSNEHSDDPLEGIFCQIDENGKISFSARGAEKRTDTTVSFGQIKDFGNSSSSGSVLLRVQNKRRPPILHMIKNSATRKIRRPSPNHNRRKPTKFDVV